MGHGTIFGVKCVNAAKILEADFGVTSDI